MGFSSAEPEWESIRGAVLLAGHTSDVPAMTAIARRLHPDVVATMLVEAFGTSQRHRIDVPDHVCVTWLIREPRGDAPPTRVRMRGERLAVAVHAWCTEWSIRDGSIAQRCVVWLGPRTSPHIARMARALVDIS